MLELSTTSDSVDYSKLEDSNYKNTYFIDGFDSFEVKHSLNKSGIVGTEYYRNIYIKNSDNIICAVFWYVGNTIYIYPVTSSYNKVNFVSYVNVYRYSNYTNKTGLEVKYTGPSRLVTNF